MKLGNATYGVEIVNGDDNVIGGTSSEARNVISGHGTGGIKLVTGANSNVVQGNYVGTDITGLVTDPDGVFPAGGPDELGNRFGAIEVNGSSNNLIGGNRNNGEGNLVSGTWQGDAIYLSGSASGNRVQGNLVGTDITGTKILPQAGGIVVFNNPGTVNLIGGTGPGEGNVVSGNGRAFDNRQGPGIEVFYDTIVQGNLVGTDITGMVALGNHGYWGIETSGNNNAIGGTEPGAGNVVSGNNSYGMQVYGTGNRVQGNLIGVAIDGRSPLGNLSYGIHVRLSGNTIGGTEPGAGNVIAYNRRGVNVVEQSGHAILGNSIFANTELGIDIAPAGVTPNDAGDADTGVNNRQNFPVLTAVTAGSTLISGTLNSNASTTFRIEFFSNTTCDSTGYGEGETFLGFTSVTTDASGNVSFSVVFPATVGTRSLITATATDESNNTSEFSACSPVGGGSLLTVDSTGDGGDANVGDGVCDDGVGACTLRAAIEESNATSSHDFIRFGIGGAGPHSIQPAGPLPDVVHPVIIDGYTQPGASPNTNPPGLGSNAVILIELDGTNASSDASGLRVTSGNSVVRGLAIGGFGKAGIELAGGGWNEIEGNLLGTDASGLVNLGNGQYGILVGGSSDNTIGGNDAGDGNVVEFNGIGVEVSGSVGTLGKSVRNAILGNFVRSNVGDGINLAGADANDGQLPPAITSVTLGSVTVQGMVQSQASSTVRIELFSTEVGDPSGAGEGAIFLGATETTTDDRGDATFNVTFSNVTVTQPYITATVTDADNNTSEFSQWFVLPQLLAPLTVDSTGDGGDSNTADEVCDDGTGACTLRAAIEQANALVGFDRIYFNISTTDPGYNSSTDTFTVSPASALPAIVEEAVVDGFTQPGASANTSPMDQPINAVYKIELVGTNAGAGVDGLRVQAGGVTIRGLTINRFSSDGVEIEAIGVVVEGNYIGTDPTGTVDLGNGGNGVFIDNVRRNTVGGLLPAARNLISGNDTHGVYVAGDNADLNTIQGNVIGLDATGVVKLGNATYGVEIVNGDNNVIGGTSSEARNVISGQGTGGIYLVSGADSNVVQGNFVGSDITGLVTDPDGVFPAGGPDELGNRFGGIEINGSSNNLIGGNRDNGEGNLVSGTWQGDAIYLSGAVSGNAVQGNLVGTDITGTKILPQAGGIVVFNNPGTVNLIEGTGPGEGNVVSGNGRAFDNRQGPGIEVFYNTIVQGNLVGTDITGMVDLGNHGYWGIETSGNNNTIGGTEPGAGNVISGNNSYGMQVYGTGNKVRGNLIGVAIDGTSALGNLSYGIHVRLSGNTIGGTEPGAGNVIAYNRRGVNVVEQSGHAILGNSIFANTQLGIDLAPAGVTPNDPGDADAGVNNLQNFPEIATAVRTFGGVTQISGTLNTTADTTTTIEFFSNAICHVSGHGEGEVFLDRASVATDGAGNAVFSHQIAQSVPVGRQITATATDDQGNTSEFSACVQVVFAPGVPSTSGLALAIMALLTGAAFLWALRRRRASQDQAV